MNPAEKYIMYIRDIRRYSEKTVRIYSDVLKDFLSYCFRDRADEARQWTGIPDTEVIEAMTRGMIRSYEAWLMNERKMNPRTVNLHLSVLSGFCRFLMKEDLMTSNPVKTVTRPKMSRRIPEIYRQSAIERYFSDTDIFVYSQADISPGDFIDRYIRSRRHGYRQSADPVAAMMLKESGDRHRFMLWLYKKRLARAIISTLYCTGMRRAELAGLNTVDLDMSRKAVTVRGKGDKTREIPLTASLCEEISLYLQAVEMICGNGDGEPALFVTARGRRIYPEYIDRAVKDELGGEEGFTGKKSPHVLRHTIATELLDNGTDLYSIKEFLGHSSLAATQVYTHNTIEKLKKVYQTAHPRAKNGGKNGD